MNKKSDKIKEFSYDEAKELIDAEEGIYYIVDSQTKNLVQKIDVKDGQSLLLIPAVTGG